MKKIKTIKTILIFMLSINVFSQLKIGQSAENVIAFINMASENRNNWTVDGQYKNGKVTEIDIYKYNQLFYDLNLQTDEIERYIMENGKYSYRISHYPKLSVEVLKSRMDDYYANEKIGKYYFTDNYEFYNEVVLMNDYATNIFRKVEMGKLPKNIQDEIGKRKKLQEQEKIDKETRKTQIENEIESDPIGPNYTADQIERIAIYPGCEKFGSDDPKLRKCLKDRISQEISDQLSDYFERFLGVSAKAVLSFRIDRKGRIIEIQLKESDNPNFGKMTKDALERVSIRLISGGRFITPAQLKDGTIVSQEMTIPLSYMCEGCIPDYNIDSDGFSTLIIPNILKRAKQNSQITGTYQKNKHNTLKIVELTSHQILFSIDLLNGSGNMGYLEDIADLDGNVATFSSNEFGLCKFQITFENKKAQIQTLDNGNECGYGNGIQSDGLFELKNNRLPKFSAK